MSKKTSFKYRESVKGLSKRYSKSRLFFLTLTPKGVNWKCPELFKKQMDSFRNNVLRRNGILFIWRAEAQENGQLHIHYLLVLPWDGAGEYEECVHAMSKSKQTEIEPFYSGRLKDFSSMLRSKARSYGIGRFSLLPIRDLDRTASYLTKCDPYFNFKGLRSFGISRELRAIKGDIAFVSEGSKRFRAAMGIIGRVTGCSEPEAMRAKFGSRWCFLNLGHYACLSDALIRKKARDCQSLIDEILMIHRDAQGKVRDHVDSSKLIDKTLSILGNSQSRRQPALIGHTPKNRLVDAVWQRATARKPNRAKRHRPVDSGLVPFCAGGTQL